MWIAYFCGFDGLAILRRLKKQSHNETDKKDEQILNDLPECVKTADKANVTNVKVLKPEEILELKCCTIVHCNFKSDCNYGIAW